jgi:hypothetical protein
LSVLGMNRILTVLLPVSFLAAVCTWGPPGARRFGLDLCRLPALGWTLEAERLQGEELDAECDRVSAQLRGQIAVARSVIGGKLTLLEAAAAIRELRAGEPPQIREVVLRYSRTATEEEWFCRLVIRFVEVILDEKPAEARAWVKRLEGELRQLLKRGPLRLPAPGKNPVQEDKNDS